MNHSISGILILQTFHLDGLIGRIRRMLSIDNSYVEVLNGTTNTQGLVYQIEHLTLLFRTENHNNGLCLSYRPVIHLEKRTTEIRIRNVFSMHLSNVGVYTFSSDMELIRGQWGREIQRGRIILKDIN